MRALVTGGSGFIGSWLVRRLVERGVTARAMARRTSDLSRLDGISCEIGYGDMTDPSTLPALLDEVDVVFHCAAALGAPSQTAFDKVNKTGTASLVDAVLEHRPELSRFVLVSSIAAGGPSTRARPRTEEDQPTPISQYGRSKLNGETMLSPLKGKVPVTIVRPPIVYGPGGASMSPLFRAVQRGLITEIGGPQRPLSFVQVHDLVAGTLEAGLQAAGEDQVFHIIGPQNGTLVDFQRAIAASLGRRAITLRPPPTAMKAAGWLADQLKDRMGIKHSFGSDKIRDGLAESWVVSDDKARTLLGFQPKIGFAEGVSETIDDYRARGWMSA